MPSRILCKGFLKPPVGGFKNPLHKIRDGIVSLDHLPLAHKEAEGKMRASQITCLVTLHGIGFEQPPQPGAENSGYADLLHLHLKTCLGAQLSDDPNRTRRPDHPGENGAIYVQSHWRDAQGRASREEGLNRIGKWCDDLQRVNITDAPLVANGEPISHVALVYSNLEPTGPAVGATLTILGMGLFASSPYANALGLLHMVLTDGLALFKYPTTPEGEPTSIRPRTDWRHPFANLVGYHGQAAPRSSPGVLAAFRNVEDDVACYVCYNEERERVRSFVREALTRLAS